MQNIFFLPFVYRLNDGREIVVETMCLSLAAATHFQFYFHGFLVSNGFSRMYFHNEYVCVCASKAIRTNHTVVQPQAHRFHCKNRQASRIEIF